MGELGRTGIPSWQPPRAQPGACKLNADKSGKCVQAVKRKIESRPGIRGVGITVRHPIKGQNPWLKHAPT